MPPGTITTAESPIVASSAQAGPPVVGTGRLKRADVERVVDAGLGRFLGQVAIEPHLSAGRFTGWSIVGLQPPELWRGVDLQLGDVVTRINGMPIERDVQAFDAFQAVRHAEQLEVSYLRQGQSLRYHRPTFAGVAHSAAGRQARASCCRKTDASSGGEPVQKEAPPPLSYLCQRASWKPAIASSRALKRFRENREPLVIQSR